MMKHVYWNGRFIDEAQACLPLGDPALIYGLGAFTTLRVTHGVPEHLDLHLMRLEQHCGALGLPKPNLQSQTVDEYIALQGANVGTWRLKIIAASQHLGMTLHPYTPPSVSSYRLCVYPEPVVRPTARLKSLSYLDRHWIKDYAHKRGYDDAVVMDAAGYVLETAFANIYWKAGNELFVPDLELPLLYGVALQVVMQDAQANGETIHQVRRRLHEIPKTAQIYVCNSLCGSISVSEVISSCS